MERRMLEKYKYHCRKAVEHFDAAAQALKENDGSPLAMVRARTQAMLAKEHRAQAMYYKHWLDNNGGAKSD